MSKISIMKRLPKYHKIYEQIFEDPFLPMYQMTKSTGISRSTISRHVIEMCELSIMKGPMIFLKPAQDYHQYAFFLTFEHPLSTYSNLKGFPHVISRNLCSGNWNLSLICEKFMNFSVLKGFRQCILQGIKGVTHLSKVTSLDWDASMEEMYSAVSPPTKKSILYEEIPPLTWKKEEWILYHEFKYNMKTHAMSILKEAGIRYDRYRRWISQLPDVAHIQTAFYPHGLDQYIMIDFLFKSEYQKQLKDILGMLPSTSIFFSVGTYLLARLSLLNKKEKDDLFSLILQLGELGFFTDLYVAIVISTANKGVK